MKKYGALLWDRWQRGDGPGKIVGKWAEDGNPYEVTVPAQLRDMLLEIQNLLSDRYTELEKFQAAVAEFERELERKWWLYEPIFKGGPKPHLEPREETFK